MAPSSKMKASGFEIRLCQVEDILRVQGVPIIDIHLVPSDKGSQPRKYPDPCGAAFVCKKPTIRLMRQGFRLLVTAWAIRGTGYKKWRKR